MITRQLNIPTGYLSFKLDGDVVTVIADDTKVTSIIESLDHQDICNLIMLLNQTKTDMQTEVDIKCEDINQVPLS